MRLKTYAIGHNVEITVPLYYQVGQLLPGANQSGSHRNEARVVIIDLCQQEQDQTKTLRFKVMLDGEDLPSGFMYAGSIASSNPRYYTHFAYEQGTAFLVYGHTESGEGKIVEVRAENAAEALDIAREYNPLSKFSHVNVR